MTKVEIKCTENGPNLVVVDGTFCLLCVGVVHLIASHTVMGLMQK